MFESLVAWVESGNALRSMTSCRWEGSLRPSALTISIRISLEQTIRNVLGNGTRSYYEAVTAGDSSVHEYYKLFEAPMMGHCFGTSGEYFTGRLVGALPDSTQATRLSNIVEGYPPLGFGTKGGYPSTMFESLVAWVESGNAPTSLPVKYSHHWCFEQLVVLMDTRVAGSHRFVV
jgi:hypothetical protein